jgi:hypothetical protein
VISSLAGSLASASNKLRFTGQQKDDIAGRLERLIDEKLPDNRNIEYDGFKIAALAQIARFRPSGQDAWEHLAESARSVPNVSDRAYVLSIIACSLPPKYSAFRRAITDEARDLIRTMRTDLDKAQRYVGLAEMMAAVDPAVSRECLKEAMQFSLATSNPESAYPAQRKIIDLAYRIDEGLAASLASHLDNDPARVNAKEVLKERLRLQDARKDMVRQSAVSPGSARYMDDYPNAAWMNLAGLNAGRVQPIRLEVAQGYVEASAALPIHECYPILAWAIENAVRRVGKTDQAKTLLLPLFEAVLSTAELAEAVASRSRTRYRGIRNWAPNQLNDKSVIVTAGEREKALEFLRDWLSNQVVEYLKICDPYFGLDDLEILRMLASAKPDCRALILTSSEHQRGLPQPLEETFRNHWRFQISDQEPPDTEVAVVGVGPRGQLPIHDRWWLTKGGGLRFGTSFNSLGIARTSEISVLSPAEAALNQKEVDEYLQRTKREHNNQKIRYNLFTL